ncbi:hypothetical protein FG386_003325 [Cryptosporidium ryanae]|uniref:uncharacterized protein n=1 Tax=Cryptosporidium ryanae TaxID=515981 RepID=UPI003519F540|nr:hypothetical protein FG386_003325 [Cryptosporidium ryanae]
MEEKRALENEYIFEGKVKIHKANDEVFYNPAQIFNRDLSIIAIKSFLNIRKRNIFRKNSKKSKCFNIEKDSSQIKTSEADLSYSNLVTTVLEPLGASGLRSIRYLKELSSEIDYLVCGDIDPLAINRMKQNFALNSIPKDKYTCICADAKRLLSFSSPNLIKQIGLLKEKNESNINNILNSLLGVTDPNNESNKYSGFTIVDIDPYGTCAPFIDGTLNSCEEDGLACFTATDMPVLCGNVPEVTFYRYGGNALKKPYCHEMSLRLLLNRIITSGAKYQKSVTPLLSVSVDFYVRVFVKVKKSAINCKNISSETGFVLQCTHCPSFHVVNFGEKSRNVSKNKTKRKRESEHQKDALMKGTNNNYDICNINENKTKEKEGENERYFTLNNVEKGERFRYKANQFNIDLYEKDLKDYSIKCKECLTGRYCIGGPIYTGKLYDDEFLEEMLGYCNEIESNNNDNSQEITMYKKIKGLLTAIKEELNDSILHYQIPSLCNFLGIEMIKPVIFYSALRNLGYKSSHFHRDPLSLKTNAPDKVVLDILRSWALLNPSKKNKNYPFLNTKIETEGITFDINPDVLFEMKASNGTSRWLPNPESNWGPISRPKKK